MVSDRESYLPEQPLLPFEENFRLALLEERSNHSPSSPTSHWFWLIFLLGGIVVYINTLFWSVHPISWRVSSDFPAVVMSSPELEDKIMKEVRSGTLPPITEDWTIGEGDALKVEDFTISINPSPAQAYLENILKILQERSKPANHFYPIRIKMHDDRFLPSPRVGAFSHGLIYFGVSYLLRAKSEAEIAAVLAHETGHAVLRHHAQVRAINRKITALYVDFNRSDNKMGLAALDTVRLFLLGSLQLDLPGILNDEQQMAADQKAQDILIDADYDFSVMFDSIPEAVFHSRGVALKRRSDEYYKNHPKGKLFIIASEEEFKNTQIALKVFLSGKK